MSSSQSPHPYMQPEEAVAHAVQGRALEEIDAIFEVRFNPFRPNNVPYTDAELRVGQAEGERCQIGRDEKSMEATKKERLST